MKLIDADALLNAICGCLNIMEAKGIDMTVARTIAKGVIDAAPAVNAAPIVLCRDCKHKKLDGPSTCKGIVNEFYCDEKLEWRYQYKGEPDILDWFCADGERADAPTCGPDYCEIGGDEDAH